MISKKLWSRFESIHATSAVRIDFSSLRLENPRCFDACIIRSVEPEMPPSSRERAAALLAEHRMLFLEPLLGRALCLRLRCVAGQRAGVVRPVVLQAGPAGEAAAYRYRLVPLPARAGDIDPAVGGRALRGVLQLERREFEVLAEVVVPCRVVDEVELLAERLALLVEDLLDLLGREEERALVLHPLLEREFRAVDLLLRAARRPRPAVHAPAQADEHLVDDLVHLRLAGEVRPERQLELLCSRVVPALGR